MHTEKEIQTLKREDKEKYLHEKEKHLKQYKALAEELEYAVDDVEYGFIQNRRERLAAKIKSLSDLLREIESMEDLA